VHVQKQGRVMNKRIPIFLGMILVIIAIWLMLTPAKFVRQLIDRLDNLAYDLQLRTRVLAEKKIPIDNIAIIDIDDKSLQEEGRWPWSRVKLAELVTALQQQGAVVIAFDVFFSEKEVNIADAVLNELTQKKLLDISLESALRKNAILFDSDAVFANSMKGNQIILATSFLPRPQTQNVLSPPVLTLTPTEKNDIHLINANGYISNIPILQNAAQGSGFINVFSDSDGIIRRVPLLMEYKGNVYPALGLRAVMEFFGEDIQLVTAKYNKIIQLEGIKLGNQVIPTDAKGQVLIPFIGRSFTFPYYSATDVLHKRLAKDTLLGKILFVGTSATGLGDLHATAIQNPFPGVEIQATLVNGILKNIFSYKPEWVFGANLFITVVLGIIAAVTFPFFGPRLLGAIVIVSPPALLFINNWIWIETRLILSFLMPVLLTLVIAILNMIYGYLFETRKRERLKEMFGQYVPEKHIDEMLKTSGDYGLHGEDREMSVLFADIRSFTTISEKMSAAALVEMLNTFFTPMTEIIFKHYGTIDKYVGDLIMAFWGAPLKDKNHATHAIESALEMREQVKLLASVLQEHQWPEIKIGIGINSGLMSVGDMGSRFRRNYTVLGDAVNLASRAEGITKFYGVDIIITEHTKQNQSQFVFRKLDKVKVKGKKKGKEIYEVIGNVSSVSEEIKTELTLYDQALDDYFQQKWDAAYHGMEKLSQKYPDTKIYHIYLERIKEFIEHPLPRDWDGVYVHTSK
jgi:adenylate cyclase